MKVKFSLDNGANIHSCREAILDTEQLGFTEGEWKALSDDEKWEMAEEWANNYIEIYWEEIE